MIDEASSGATIGGGINNYIGMDSPWAGVFGGLLNKIGSDSPASFLGGGQDNSVLTDASHAFLGGGVANVVRSNTLGCSIIGGRNNTVVQQAESSAVFAGAFNQVTGTNSAAGGHRAQALHNGTFVWGDGTDADIASTNANSVTMRATGGYRLFSSTSPSGVYLAAGSGSWTSLSDRNAKENLEPINPRQVLEKVAGLKVSKWNYKAQPDAIRHIGPMAQDFTAAFGVGESDTGITSIDADGVALAAIQGLHELVKEKDAALKEQQKTVDELSTRLRALEKVLLNEVSAK
jgi:hypothetical protein